MRSLLVIFAFFFVVVGNAADRKCVNLVNLRLEIINHQGNDVYSAMINTSGQLVTLKTKTVEFTSPGVVHYPTKVYADLNSAVNQEVTMENGFKRKIPRIEEDPSCEAEAKLAAQKEREQDSDTLCKNRLRDFKYYLAEGEKVNLSDFDKCSDDFKKQSKEAFDAHKAKKDRRKPASKN